MKALIKVGYGCNENCTFCHTLHVRHIDGSAAEVHAKIERAKALGHDMVVLSGGEPTIRPELIEWADHVVALGMDFGLVTNGLMLAYPELVGRLLERRLRYVYMSLHGGSAPVHNRMVRTDAFEHAKRAIENLSGRGLDFTVNTVVARQNLEHLRGMVDLVLPYPDLCLKFSMLQPKGGGERAFDALMPRVSDVAARVLDAVRYGLERAGANGPRFAHDGLPLCLLPGLEQNYDDLKTHRFATMVEIGESDFYPVDDKDKVQPEACRGCALRGPCPGLFRSYHASFGAAELRPVHDRPRSNSFNYTFEALVTDAHEGPCPLLSDGVTPWDRARHLFVKNGRRIARFRTQTRDFSDVEVEAIKHAQGQVYLDVSKKAAPDDFARDLVKLEKSTLCAGCSQEPRCTGMFEPVFEDLFTRDEAAVRELIGGLHGDVLDVGCGEGVHEDLFAELATSGRVRYVGLDPDAERIETLRARRPWGELRVGAAEALTDAGRFDEILVLRSWNHLRDPELALRSFWRALRPGAALTIVDNEAFGLARTARQSSKAESSSSRFEHYRNDGAEAVRALAGRHGFEELARAVAGPRTSNQWMVRYRKSSNASA
ncbi:MAG TPA: radical SAM protein [Polyangiaceae bacterium]